MSAEHNQAIAAILAVYRAHVTGGKLHEVLDDWNLTDAMLQHYAQQDGLSVVEAECLARLRRLTETERFMVLAAAEVDMSEGYA